MYTFFSILGRRVTSFDIKLLDWIHLNLSNSFLNQVMPFITKLCDGGIIWIVVALVLLIPKKTRKTGIAIGVALTLGLIIGNGVLKNLIARTRPFDIPGPIVSRNNLLIPPPTDYSFPSGHTLASFEAATVIYRDHTLLGFAAFVMAGIIAFSRIYLCVHYPSDVVGGAILGVLLGLLGCKIVRGFTDIHQRHLKKKAEAAQEK